VQECVGGLLWLSLRRMYKSEELLQPESFSVFYGNHLSFQPSQTRAINQRTGDSPTKTSTIAQIMPWVSNSRGRRRNGTP
jgi:hypothetical protein